MAKTRVYRTKNGDNCDLIRANLNLIDIAIFDSNIPIIIPDFVDTGVNEDIDKLPPWKR